jgi:phosphoribosyl 1,2-cyclic phosphodiesterase
MVITRGSVFDAKLEGPQRTVILDAGTGIRELGKETALDPHLGIDRPCFLAFSHFHWDHIQGLPSFGPAYDARRTFTVRDRDLNHPEDGDG